MISSDLLRGPRIRLTALTHGDVPTLARWQEDVEFMHLFDARPAYPRDQGSLYDWLAERQKSPDCFLFAIRPLEGDDLWGYAELEGIAWTHRTCWLSIGLGDRAHWGQGFGAEAMRLLLAYAYRELNLYQVGLTVFSYNARAIALYEKLGFQREGVAREFLQRNGQRFDMYYYGLLSSEWEATQAATLRA